MAFARPTRRTRNPASSISASSSEGITRASSSTSSTGTDVVPRRPAEKSRAKSEFKRLCRLYMAKKAVPSTAEAARLAALAGTFTWLDVVEWQEELGMHRGVIFDAETESVCFEEYPRTVHEAMAGVFSYWFQKQFVAPWDMTPHHPNFVPTGAGSKAPNIIWYRRLTLQLSSTLVDTKNHQTPHSVPSPGRTTPTFSPRRSYRFSPPLESHGQP